MNWRKWIFWGSEDYSPRTLYLVSILSLVMAIVLFWADLEKERTIWPEESTLEVAVGQVARFSETDRKITFWLNGNCKKFNWWPLYGRNWSQVENALRTPNAIIEVKFIAQKPPEAKRECGTFDIYALTRNGESILTYGRSQATFKKDAELAPWLWALFLLAAPYFIWAARLKQQGKIG